MFSFFARLGIFLALPMAALSVSAVLFGGTQLVVHPSLRGFVEGCENIPQPCWYGIVPAQTPLNEALIKIEQLGFVAQQETTPYGVQYRFAADLCVFTVYINDAGMVSAILAAQCQALHLGDFINVLGTPLIVTTSMCDPDSIGFYGIVLYPLILYRTASVQRLIDSFWLTSRTSVIRPWRDFQPYGHFGRAAHRSPRRCG